MGNAQLPVFLSKQASAPMVSTFLKFAVFTAFMLTACETGAGQQPIQATIAIEEQNTPTVTLVPSETFTPAPSPTVPLFTRTPPSAANAPGVYINPTAEFTALEGWSCGDFPCEDDITGFLERIRVPSGYSLSHVGRFPGQPMQIVYGPDGRLYATVLEDGVRNGAVYVMKENGQAERYSDTFISPIGLAFQPGTDMLYVSARMTPNIGGGIWRVYPNGTRQPMVIHLPCCFSVIDNQPNGLIFGEDGYLYVGVGALTDHAEAELPQRQTIADIYPHEASILRIHPYTGVIKVYAEGIRNPYDLTLDASGQMYATDNGILKGPGDRLLRVDAGGHYGWPFWKTKGCEDCPARNPNVNISPDLLPLPDYTLPRGLVAYTGQQFPKNIFGSLFVTLWHNTPNAQRVVRIDPKSLPTDPEALAEFEPEPFITGLIRPVDVALAPDGSLVVADFIYGHVWRVSYGETARSAVTPQEPRLFVTSTPKT